MASPIERVTKYVKQFDPALEPLVFAEPMKTSESAAEALGVEIGQIAKSILFRSDERFALFVAAGDVRIHPKRVKAAFGTGKPKMATPQEVEAITGFQVGAVCPFALQTDIPVFVDQSLNRFPVVYTAGGIAESLLPVSFEALTQMTRAQIIDAAAGE